MNRQMSFDRWAISMMAMLFLALMPLRIDAATAYIQHNLVSDIPLLGDFTDSNLVNPWGMTTSATSPFWVCDQRTGLSTVYSASGGTFAISTLVVTVPAPPGKTTPGTCTGIVTNTSSPSVFAVTPGNNANFIFATEDGTISAWNRTADATHAIIKIDRSASGAVYKGLALYASGAVNFIYGANFNAGTIDAWDGNFAKATLTGAFADPAVPAGFAPFNIQNLGGNLYVTYAKQDTAKHDDIAGAGNGYVAEFDFNGNLIKHLVSGGPLNSPWGVAIAPSTFGDFKGDLLVGNFRDGTINAFDPVTGAFAGTLKDPAGNPIVNIGIWGIQFGNGGSGGDPTKLYLNAGISAGTGIQSHGLLASIAVATTVGAVPVVNDAGAVNNASYAAGTNPVAPGTITAIFGSNLTDGTSCIQPNCNPTFRADGKLNSTMNGAQVLVNGLPVPMLYATPSQLGAEIPTDLTGTSATLQVTVGGQTSAAKTITVGPYSPGVFTFTADGKGAGAITHADGTPVNTSSPAAPAEVVIIYATGFGQVTPAVSTGAVASGTVNTVTMPTVTMDGLPAQVQFSGLSSCCVGLNQMNVMVPAAVRAANDIPVVVTVGGQQANAFTIATKAGPLPLPPPVTLTSLTSNPPSMMGGSSAQGAVVLSAAPSSDMSVDLSSSNSAVASVPASVTVAAGSSSANFTITTSPVTVSTTVNITASAGGATQTTALTVTPAPPPPPPPPPPITVSSLSLNFNSVMGGSSSQGTVVLSAAASSDTSVTLSSSNSSVASVPASVTVAAGSTSATFTITTKPVTVSSAVTISASAGGVTQTSMLSVSPPPPPNPYPYY